MYNQTTIPNDQTCLKLKLKDTVYKINGIKGETLDELKVNAFNKFGLSAQDCKLIAKIPKQQNIEIENDSDVMKAVSLSKTDKKGRKVLDIKLEERLAPVASDKEICFENWNILSDSEKTSLKENAKLKAKATLGPKDGSDSETDKQKMRDVMRAFKQNIESDSRLKGDKKLCKKLWNQAKGEFCDLLDSSIEKCAKKNQSDSSVSPDFKEFKNHTGTWDSEKWATFKALSQKFPEAPQWMIGKLMKNRPNKSAEKLGEILSAKIAKFSLTTDAQKAKFSALREDFPRMPEFMLNRMIVKNPEMTMDELKKRGLKLREKFMKFRKDRSQSPNGKGPWGGMGMGKGCGPMRGLWAKISGRAGDLMTKFQTLEAKFPDFPKMHLGKMVLKNTDLSVDELTVRINKKIGKFSLTAENQRILFDELRLEFPHMPSFFLNKIISKNGDKSIDQLREKVSKRKAKHMAMKDKFGGAMRMVKGWMGCKSGSTSRSRSNGKGKCQAPKQGVENWEMLCAKFPQFPKWKIGKIMKRNPDMTVEQVAKRIVERLSVFELTTEAQRATFEVMRQNFPRMPEFVLNKMITKNPDMTIDQLIAKGIKKREGMWKK